MLFSSNEKKLESLAEHCPGSHGLLPDRDSQGGGWSKGREVAILHLLAEQ